MPKLPVSIYLAFVVFAVKETRAVPAYFDVFVPGKDIAGTKSGCPCWFDPGQKFTTATECPCCPTGYLPCGYPNHKRCYKPLDEDGNIVSPGSRVGCAGIAPYPAWTLSTQGAPCHFDPTDYSCAICTTDAYQCSNYADPIPDKIKTKDKATGVITTIDTQFPLGQYCRKLGSQYNYRCWGNIQDCRNNPQSCDPNATCVDSTFELIPDDPSTPSISEKETRFYCKCKTGYTGNGFVCVPNGSVNNLDLVDFKLTTYL